MEHAEVDDDVQEIPAPRRKRRRLENDSSSTEQKGRGVDTVEFEEHADGKYAEQALYKFLDERDISILVGLATTNRRELDIPINSMAFPAFEASLPTNRAVENHPLVGLASSPLPPSQLNYLARRALEIPNFKSNLLQRFDRSALIAIGMFLEEIVTASMLPLSGCHVMRCRDLEARSGDTSYLQDPDFAKRQIHPISGQKIDKLFATEQQAAHADNAYDEWTIPPEEALHKIAQQQRQQLLSCCNLPSTLPATRATTDPGRPEAEESISSSWCREQQLDPSFVKKNMDLLRLFLPSRETKGSPITRATENRK